MTISRRPTGLIAFLLTASMVFPTSLAAAETLAVRALCDRNGTDCQALTASLALDGDVTGQIVLAFRGAQNLDPGDLSLTAELVDPADASLRQRLPRTSFIPSDFPVLVRIEPSSTSDFTFQGAWTLEMTTDSLEHSTRSPFRILQAARGTPFSDITSSLGGGGLRLQGTGAGFSEFVIASDLRPAARVAAAKLARLQLLLDQFGSSFPSLSSEFQALLAAVRTALEAGELSQAIGSTFALLRRLDQAAGQQIPDVSRPNQASPAGLLGSAAVSLRQSLVLARQLAEEPAGGISRAVTMDGGPSFDLSITFDQSFVLSPDDLEITAEIVDPRDPQIRARFPDGVQVPADFPVLIRIRTRSTSGDGAAGSVGTPKQQAFSGAFEIELDTDALAARSGSPLRLFKAPDGGAFEDITKSLGLGSFRVGGAGGSFSDVMVAGDERDIETIISAKVQRLGDLSADPMGQVEPEAEEQLDELIDDLQEDVDSGMLEDAVDTLEELEDVIEDLAGQEDLPSVWRSDREDLNLAGEMLSTSQSLRFAIEQELAPSDDPNDVNRDGQVDLKDLFQLIDQLFG